MSSRKGKTVALLSLIAAVAVVVAFGWAFRRQALELWLVHQLGSRDRAVRAAAAMKLGEQRSLRAVPVLIAWLRSSTLRGEGRDESLEFDELPLEILTRIGPAGVRPLLEAASDTERKSFLGLFPDHDTLDVVLLTACLDGASLPVRRALLEALDRHVYDGAPDLPEAALQAVEAALKVETDRGARIAEAVLIAPDRPGLPAVRSALLEALNDLWAWKDAGEERPSAVDIWIFQRIAPFTPYVAAALGDALRQRSTEVKREAASALADLGEDARPAIGALLTALDDADEEVRGSALFAIKAIIAGDGCRREVEEAVPRIKARLDQTDLTERRWAMKCLETLAPYSPEAARALIPLLATKPFRPKTCRALEQVEEARLQVIAALIASIRGEDLPAREGALRIIAEMGPAAMDTVPAMSELLDRPTHDYNECPLFEALASMGPEGREAVPALVRVLERGSFKGQLAANALAAMEGEARRAVPALIGLLKHPGDPWDGRSAVDALTEIAPDAPEVREALEGTIDRLDDEHPVKLDAIAAMGRIGRATGMVPPVLLRALDRCARLKVAAAEALGDMGPAAKAGVDRLRQLVWRESNPEVRFQAAKALWKITGDGKELAIQLLVNLSVGRRNMTIEPEEVIGLLAELGEDGRTTGAPLAKAMEDLEMIPPESLADLAEISWAASIVAPRLVTLLGRAEFKRAAADGLEAMSARAVPALIDALGSIRPRGMRGKIMAILGKIGPAAGEAVPALRLLLSEEDEEVRDAAVRALEKIEGPARIDGKAESKTSR